MLCSLVHSFNCLAAAYKRNIYPINSLLGLCRKIVLAVITHLLRDNKADRIKQTTLLKFDAVLETK